MGATNELFMKFLKFKAKIESPRKEGIKRRFPLRFPREIFEGLHKEFLGAIPGEISERKLGRIPERILPKIPEETSEATHERIPQ